MFYSLYLKYLQEKKKEERPGQIGLTDPESGRPYSEIFTEALGVRRGRRGRQGGQAKKR